MIIDNDRYRLGTELGRGGMGVIYRAHDDLLNRDIAVKVLSGEITEEGRRRLLREAQSAARLNHPNIVSVYDVLEIQGSLCVVMELVEGESLHNRKPSNIEAIVPIAVQICRALAHAHAHGVIHRDLKPENIILTSDGTVKLLDFGLARSIASRISVSGAIVGTVFYMAPELALGKEADERADLYSLGIILYELVAGRLPFSGDDPLAVISQQLYAPVVPPSTYQAEAAGLEPIILRLLAKNPDNRFSSAQEVADALLSATQPQLLVTPTGESGSIALLELLARGRMVGRLAELNQLRELWARSQQGHVHLVLLSGEPGIGKTRLANELVVQAQLSGASVLRGGCYEYEASTPYLPFVEALREWVNSQADETLRSYLGSTANELARLAPEILQKLGPLPANPALSPNEERLRLFDNVTRFFQSLAERSGLLLFIDDLHWADQGTISLLHYVLRNLREKRVLILAAYREIELDRAHPLAAALVEWNRERLATRISLVRLSFEDTGALLGTLFGQENISADFTQVLYKETEGNPFFIEEVVKALIEQGQIYREGNRWERKEIAELAIPQSVKEAIGRRLGRLSQNCLDVLHSAAALGKDFDYAGLVSASPVNEDKLLDALDEASAAQLLRMESGEYFAFTHDKIREVLYEEINPIRLKRLHQRIGEGLEKRYSRMVEEHVEQLAYHFTQSGDLSRSLNYSLLAAEKTLSLFALHDALHYYEYAYEAAEALNQNNQLAVIHSAIGDIYSIHGPVAESVEHYEAAIALQQDRSLRGAIKARIGSIYASVGDERGVKYSKDALNELDPVTQPNDVALATAMIGRYYHYKTLHQKTIEYLERARQIAEPHDDTQTLMIIYAYLAGAYQHLTRFDESMGWARKSISLGQRKNNPLAEAFGYEFLAENSLGMGLWKDALEYAASDHQIGLKIEARERVIWSEYCTAYAEFSLGKLHEAEQRTLTVRWMAEDVGDKRIGILAGGVCIQALGDLGKQEDARALASQVLQEADQIQHIYLQSIARHSIAYGHIARGEFDQALDLYLQCEELIAPGDSRWAAMLYRPYLAQALLETGRVPEAASMVGDTLEIARAARSRICEAIGLRVQAQISVVQAQAEAANDAINLSIALLDEIGSQLELGRSLRQRGLICLVRGENKQAQEDFNRALDLFKQIGAIDEAARMEKR